MHRVMCSLHETKYKYVLEGTNFIITLEYIFYSWGKPTQTQEEYANFS